MQDIDEEEEYQEVGPGPETSDGDESEGDESEEMLDKRRAAFEPVILRLATLAEQQVGYRQLIEDRWVEDARQYAGRYDTETENRLRDTERSALFVRATKQKTDGWSGRLADMLFPTDDKNWGLLPTKVPTDGNGQTLDPKQAEEMSKAMEEEIEDQLQECDYAGVCRKVIADACMYGTGILKGPIKAHKPPVRWGKATDGPQVGQWAAGIMPEGASNLEFRYVSVWDFFPDMSATCIDDAEFIFERHVFTRSDLRKLAKVDGFDAEMIRELLEEGPQGTLPNYLPLIQDIADVPQSNTARYDVWEYHGPLEPEDMEQVCACLQGDDEAKDIAKQDVLNAQSVVIWFCQGKLLKIGPHPLDSEECLYKVFVWDDNPGSVFGNGVPSVMRDSQRSINAAWRMLHDNAAYSVAPQIVIDRKTIVPEDGSWNLTPGKVWEKRDVNQAIGAAFQMFPVVGNQQELLAIVKVAMELVDQEVNLPLLAQGESGAHQTQTAQGMSMLANAANVGFRRVVRMFDDAVTLPAIRHAYEWNMQHNERDDIKGDYRVDARGSSVLLVKEAQSQNLMAILMNFSAHPVLGPLLKVPEMFRALMQSYSMSTDLFVKSEEELQQAMEEAQAAQQGQQAPSPEEIKLQIAQMDSQTKLEVAAAEREIAQMRLAADQNMTLEQLKAQLDIAHTRTAADLQNKQADRDHRERLTAVEMATMERRNMAQGFIAQ